MERPIQSGKRVAFSWLRLSTAVAMLCAASLAGGLILGWVGRGALVADPTFDAEVIAGDANPGFGPTVETLPMPDVRGLTEADARQVIADAGYTQASINITETPSVAPSGTIAAQDPVAGTENPTKIVLSLPAPAHMPEIKGKGLEEAARLLAGMGAKPIVNRVYSPTVPTGTVISSEPLAGAALTATPTLIVAGAASSAPLNSLKSTGSCTSVNSGSINGTQITQGVRCSVRREASSTFWILGRGVHKLQAVVGIEDTAEKEDRARVMVTGDGNVLLDQEVAYGQSANIDADVSNVLRLEIEVSAVNPGTGASNGSSVVFGNAVVFGSAEAIAALDTQP